MLKVFAFIMILVLCIDAKTQLIKRKCTDNDPRILFDGCMLYHNHMTLWCDRTNFTSVPEPNQIQSKAPCTRAKALYMNDSCVENLDGKILQQYVSLKLMDFSENKLKEITKEALCRARHLRELDVSLNEIAYIDTDSFRKAKQMRKLNFIHNRLSGLGPGIFRNLRNLEVLHLDRNQLTSVDLRWFPDSCKLRTLTLQHNRIQNWIKPKQNQFLKLTFLDLDGNKIIKLEPDNLANMPALELLHLEGNLLLQIKEGTFDQASSLKSIDLRNNLLESLPKDIFSKLCDLRTVLLTGNKLVIPYSDWFVNILRNDHLHGIMMSSPLANNAWSCDCKAHDYWIFLQQFRNNSLHRSLSKHFNIECRSPAPLERETLSQIDEERLISFGSCDNIRNNNSKNQRFLEHNQDRSVRTGCDVERVNQLDSSASSPIVVTDQHHGGPTTIIFVVIPVIGLITIIVISLRYKMSSVKR